MNGIGAYTVRELHSLLGRLLLDGFADAHILIRDGDFWRYIDTEHAIIGGQVALPLGLEAENPHPSATDHIVIRFAEDYPRDWIPEGLDGLWMERPPAAPIEWVYGDPETTPNATAIATQRVETREDGARAQVFEVRRG